MTIEIDDRLYWDIDAWCHANDRLPVSWYILTALREKFLTDKFGDLNEKFNKKAEFVFEKPEDLPTFEIKETEPVHIAPSENAVQPSQQTVEGQPGVSETVENPEQPVKKRTLKIK